MSLMTISQRILGEINSRTKDPILSELAKNLLQFEMENWKMEKVHFKDHYESVIEEKCNARAKRKGKT